MSYTVEKDWTTKAGLRAVVIVVSFTTDSSGKELKHHRCGYVGVTPDSIFVDASYDSLPIDCHGGLTYSSSAVWRKRFPVESTLYWFGFDCGHCDDGIIEPRERDIRFGHEGSRESVKSLEFCIAECESIAAQLQELDSK